MNYLDSLKQQHPEITKYSDDEIISVLPKIDPSLSGMEPQALRSFALAEQEPSGLWGLAKSGYHNVKGARAVSDAASDLNDLNDPEFYAQDLQPRKVQTGSLLGMSGDELRRRSVASTGGEDQLMQEAQRRLDKGTEQYQKAAQYKLSPTTEQFLTGSLNPDSDILSDLMADPVTIIAEIGAQSAYGSLESALQGAAMGVVGGPAGMAVGSGTGSARIEFANSLVEGLREAGVDVTDARKLRAQLAESPDLFAQVADKAKKRAASVGVLDGASMGLASVPMGIGRNTATKIGTNLVFQGAAQSGLGAGGEALGQYAADGEISDMRAIAAEAAGELVTAPVDVAAATYGGMNGRNASAADRAAASTDEAIQQAKQFEDQLNRTSFFSGKPNGQVTAADMGLQMPEQRDWSQYEASPAERPMAEAEPQQQEQAAPRQSARDMSGLDGLIITADRMGFTDEAALLRTSQRLYRQADEARARGDDAAVSRFVERGNRLYREATETNDQVREIADQFPVPYVAQGEVTSGELVPSNAPNFTMPEPDIQGEGVTVSTRSNQPLLEQQTARLELNNPETPFVMGRDPEPRPERTFTPVPDEVEGVGRNTVERTAQAKTNALPAGNATRAITPEQYRQVIEQVQLANRTPRARQTPEMLEALEVRQQVRNGDIQVTETPEQPVMPEAQQLQQQPAIEQPTDMRAPNPPEVRLRANGQPFANERAARISPAFRDNRDYASVVPVDGGFAVQIDTQARDQAETQAAESAQAKSEQAKRRMFREPDTLNDDILDAIALMGGIDRAEAEAEGIDPAVFNRRAAGIRPIFTRQNGDSFDGMAERLAQYGYLDARADRLDDLRAKLDQAINGGRKIMTPEGYEALAEKELAAEAQLQEEHAPLADDITSDEAWAGEAYAMAAEAGVPINVIDAILEQYSTDPIATLVELNDAINEVENARAAQAGEGTQGRSADTEIPWNEPGNLTAEQAAEIFGAVEPEPLLTAYTEADLQAQADAQAAAEQTEAESRKRAEDKAAADAQVNDFSLTGSSRPADVAAAAGQNDMFGLGGTPRVEQPAPQQQAEPAPQPIESAVDAIDELNQRINNGEAVTAAEVRRVFEYVAGNQEAVKTELNKLKKDELKRLVSGHVWSDTKKAELVDRAYDSMVGDFRFIGNESGVITSTGFGTDNRLNQARDHVNALTDEQVTEYAKSRKAIIDERMAERKQLIDALKNPQTLAEYRESIRVLGMDKLTPEQRATYDRLVAEEAMAQRQPQSERAGLQMDEQVELGEPTEGTHSKTGETIFNVKVITRLGKDKFKEAAAFARSMGGGYFRGTGSFHFKSREDAELFSGWVNGESVDLSERNQQRQEQKQANAADKLKAMADRIEQQASEALNADRKENTIKRIDEGERARSRAKKELQIAGVLKAIPDSDTVVLKNATQKVQIELLETLTRSLVHYAPEEQLNKDNYSRRTFKDEVTPEQRVQHARMPLTAMSVNAIRELANQMLQVNGYVVAARGMIKGMQGRRPDEYVNFNNQKTINKVLEFVEQHSDQYSPLRDAAADYKRLQRMGITSPPLLRTALLEYMALRDSVTGADTSNRLQQLERDLQRRVIGNRNAFNDFFPTPEAVAEEVVAQAEIEPGMRVLEPSAGNGMLADAAKAAGAEVDVVEMGGQLREILSEKGYNLVGDDFLEYQAGEQYDRIVMNPPFSKDQDIQHVQHAYTMLKPGGKLVAIVSSMAGDRANTRNRQFREWLDSLDAVEQPLPQGAFLSSMNQTGVNTKVLVIEKPISDTETAPQAEASDSNGNTVTAQGITIEVPTIDQQLVDDYNRATHMGRGRDLNAELRSEAEGLLNELGERKYTLDTPEQKAEAKRLIESYLQAQAEFSQWDARYSANNPSWIVTGRSGRNMDKSNRANERHMDEYTKRVDRLQASRDRIAERLYNMRPQEVQENQALMKDLREATRMAGTILADIDSKVLATETRKWASPKAHKLIERSLDADRGRTIEHIRELENTKAVQDAGGLVKVFGPRSKAGKLVQELLQAPPALQRRGFEPLGIESVVTADKQPDKGMPVEKVQALVDAFQKAYNGNVPLKFKVANTQEELYGKGATIEEYGVIKGSYHPASGEVRLAARNLSEMGDAVETLRHEVLGHYGLNTFTPADKRRILDQLIEARDSEGPLAGTWAEIDELYADKSDDIRAEEVFAKVVESEPAKVGRLKAFVDRLLYNLNAALRRAGIIKSPLKMNDVRRMARYVAEGIRSGRRQQQTFPASDEALFRRGGPQPDPGAFAVPEETWANVALRKMADKFKVLKDLQKNIQDAGGTVNESNDAYLAEELFHGKTEEDLRQMRETFIKPLADKMAKFGIEQKDLDQYLYAKHAPERNAHIAEINPELQEAGSGMSDAKAAEIIQQVRDSGKLEQYEQLAGMVYDMLETRRETMRSAGLEEDGMIDAWENKYEFYVPLKGWAVDEQQDGMARTGSGFNIAGKESKRAMGRSSEAASPSSYAIQDLTETLIRRRKNEVGNALLNLVQDNPNKGYWQVFTNENPDMDRRIFKRKDPMTGETIEEVREAPIPMAMMSDKYFQTKRNGKTYYIKLEDERLMKAMKNIGPDTSNFLIRTLGSVNRILSSLNTSYNPEFVVGNFARDVQTAVLNLMAEQSRDDGKVLGEKIAKQTVKDIPKAMRAVYRGLRNKDEAAGGEWQKWFTEFREAGAKTGWFDMKDIDGQAADLQTLISMSKGGVKGNAMKWFKATGQMVEDLNGSVENAVRLSAYVNARKAGISQAKAASLAKNMTVNFNRRGEVGTTLNAFYMFANASIQGSMNFARTMIGLKGQKGDPIWQRLNTAQKVAAGLVMGSYAIAMANRAGAGEDDDGENWYDKVPDYVKERNLVIMKSLLGGDQDGSYWTIPLPYGYNIFHVLGNALEGTTNGNTSIGKAATDLTLATLGSFSPIGFQESQSLTGTVVRNITPTLGKPLVDIGFNENFMGTSIYSENFPFGTPQPESQLGRRSTPEGYKAIAEFLNEVSGGSQWRSGYIDINPDVMRYVANYFTGAAGKFVFDKAPNNLYHLATLTPIEARETLFISRVSGRVLPYADREKFYSRRDEIGQIEAEWKGLRGADRMSFYRDNRSLIRLKPLIKSSEKQLKALRQQRDRIYALDLPRKQQEARMEVIDARMKRVIDRFNREYAKATGGD
jgi:phospholipid N-methyltransferase